MRSFLAPAAFASLLLTAGCALTPRTTAQLTYDSRPAGATLYEGGQSLGIAPVTRTYAGDGKSPDIRTPEVTAVWPSGARATFWTNLKVGDDRAATLERPPGAPDLALDEANAKTVAAANAQDAARAKAAALSDQARGSARCQAQQHAGIAAVDDCR